MTDQQQALKVMIDKAQKIAVIGHEYADGDCVWSVVGMTKILANLGKEVRGYTNPWPMIGSGGKMSFWRLSGSEQLSGEFVYRREYDLIVVVDCGDLSRLGPIYDADPVYFSKQAPNIAIIDHHPVKSDPDVKLWIQDISSSSTCEMVYELIEAMYPQAIDAEVATALYTGLTTDTGNFFREKDSVRTMRIALDLIKKGADKKLVIDSVYRSVSMQSVQFMTLVLSRLTVGAGVCWSWYHEDEMREYGLSKGEADKAQGMMQSIDDPAFCVLFRVIDGNLKASTRSKTGSGSSVVGSVDAVNCTEVAGHFGGGGHARAAGFKLPLEEDRQGQIKKVVSEIE